MLYTLILGWNMLNLLCDFFTNLLKLCATAGALLLLWLILSEFSELIAVN